MKGVGIGWIGLDPMSRTIRKSITKGCVLFQNILGGGFKYFYFHPYLGKESILANIFQMGRNHQLVFIQNGFLHLSLL